MGSGFEVLIEFCWCWLKLLVFWIFRKIFYFFSPLCEKKGIFRINNLHQMDLNAVPFPFKDREFDAIVCCGVLTFARDKPGLFKEWHRLLLGEQHPINHNFHTWQNFGGFWLIWFFDRLWRSSDLYSSGRLARKWGWKNIRNFGFVYERVWKWSQSLSPRIRKIGSHWN